jgi:hypothetical protein
MMLNKKNITGAPSFIIAVVSSALLLITIAYSDKLWSELWLLSMVIDIIVIFFFLASFIKSLIFWIKKNPEYHLPFVPLAINVVFLAVIMILPLNYIRNKIEFSVNRTKMEEAVNIILFKKYEQNKFMYYLPEDYQYLSAGRGQVMAINDYSVRAVFFYTFRGVPDGMKGFVKIKDYGTIQDFKENFGSEVIEIKDLGDNWYFVSAD